MKIEKLKISNFGILANVELDMSKDEGRLVFVNGQNGRGKTTFQSALRWCFYGDEPTNTNKFVSNFAIKDIAPEIPVEVTVSAEVTLDHGIGLVYIERSQQFVKQINGVPKKIGFPSLIVRTKSQAEDALSDVIVNPEAWLAQYFPHRLLNFFLFDGESMTNFFNANVREEIEKAVREIAGVDLFEKIADKLSQVEGQLTRKVAKLTGSKTEQIASDLQAEQAILAEIFGEFQTTKLDLSNKKSRLLQVNADLNSSGDLQNISKRLDQIDAEINLKTQQQKTDEQVFNIMLLTNGANSLLVESFTELDRQVELAKSEDRLPPPFEPARIMALIEAEKCICGSPLHKGDEKTEALLLAIDRFKVSSDVGKLLDSTSRDAEKLRSLMQGEWISLQTLNKAIAQRNTEIAKLRNEKEDLTRKMQLSDLATVRALALEKESLDNDVDRLTRLEATLKVQADNSAAKVDRLDKALAESSKGNQEAEIIRKQAQTARRIAVAANQIHAISIEQVRKKLQGAISEKFSQVKEGKFHTEITENFEVLTLNENGTKAALSEGESMAKAYVFSLALRDVINLGFPLIVDTPFGRLSEDFRDWLSRILSDFLLAETKKQNRQIIFLMTDTEYTPFTRKSFSAAKPLEFYLTYENGNETTKSILGEGIDPKWTEFSAWKAWSKGKLD